MWAQLVLVAALLSGTRAVPPSQRSVTNEDIRDAILSAVHMLRSIDDKLERHEFRERALGDHVKKNLVNIDKRIKSLDPIKGTIGRLDERLATVETILMQKDERERVQLQKTFDTVEDIQKNLPTIMEKLKSDIIEKMSTVQVAPAGLTKKDLDDIQKAIAGKLDNVTSSSKKLEDEIATIKKANDEFKKDAERTVENLDRVKKQLSSSELLLGKYEHKLSEYNNRIPTEVIPIDYKEQKDWQTGFMQVFDQQKVKIEKISGALQSLNDKVNALPAKTDLEKTENTTLDALEELKYETMRQTEKSAIILDAKVKELISDNDKKHEEVVKSVSDLGEMTEGITENFGSGYEQLRKEISALAKVEQVMIQTADGVIDTKRKVEYGVHQIILEMGTLVKEHGEKVTNNINERFDNFELSVLDSESGALANLTSKIGQEIDQVWRQIGIMHQQMSASTDTLNKLQNQTDTYVNGSLDVMDSMKGKVSKITGRMSEVDENLNYLLGRLSLVTQEFNLIKSGLGTALDEIRGSFMEVQSKIKDSGPGPHQIASNELDDNNNNIK